MLKSSLIYCLFVQTTEEVAEKMTGLLLPMQRNSSNTMALDDKVERLPKTVDYRKKGMVSSVKNQVRIGASVFSTWNKICWWLLVLTSGQLWYCNKNILD